MSKWIFGFLVATISGLLITWLVPGFAAFGIIIAAVSSVILLQATLLAVALAVGKPRAATLSEPSTELLPSELSRVLGGYRDFKLFLGRLTGILGLVYGIVMHSLYFALLGAAATLLFWVLDRMHDSWFQDLKGRVETPLGENETK